MKTKKQTIYIALIQEYKEYDCRGLCGKIYEGKAQNIHDNIIPIWENIEYDDVKMSMCNSFDEYHINLGPNGENCLIFTNLNEAIKRLYQDIRCFLQSSYRMSLYDIIRPMVFDNETPYQIIFIDKQGKERIVEDDEALALFSKEEQLMFCPHDPFEAFETDDEKE